MALARQMKLTADLNAQLATRLIPGVLQQGDANANVFTVNVYRGKEAADLSGCSATGYFQRGDSDRVPLEGTIEGNVVSVPLAAECYAVSGDYMAFVRLINAETGEKTTILRIIGYVETEGSGAILDPNGRIPSIEDVIAQLDEMERATEETRTATQEAQAAAEAAELAAESGEKAEAAAETAESAAARANNATVRAMYAALDIERMTAEARSVPYGTGASAELDKSGDAYNLIIYAEQGPQGKTGHGLDIRGTYASLAALQAAVTSPSQGEMYNVGTQPPYSIYMWQESTSEWEYQGELQGATGAHYTPVITEEPGAVWLGFINNGGLQNPERVNIRGEDGYTPQKGVDYFTPTEKAEFVQSVLEALPNASGVSF